MLGWMKKRENVWKAVSLLVAGFLIAGSLSAGFCPREVRAAIWETEILDGDTKPAYGSSPYEESGFDDEYYRNQDKSGASVSGLGQEDSTEGSGADTSQGSGTTTSVQEEPATSDLTLVQAATTLASKRWIQSFCKDDKYYYFLQMTNPYKGHLRLTRVQYSGVDKYTSSYMDLKFFGHGTNLDCSKSGGTTLLWTGGDCKKNSWTSTSITAFPFTPGKVLIRHGAIRYKIPKGRYGSSVSNVYPAVNINSNRLAVRYTYKGAQYFQVYKLRKGRSIRIHHPLKSIRVKATAGDFQGFDITGKTIYTIEGSPTKKFLSGYDKKRKFQPTIIRTIHYKTKKKTSKTIKGASLLTFREPEGVKVVKGKKVLIMFVSGTLTNMKANIYKVKR